MSPDTFYPSTLRKGFTGIGRYKSKYVGMQTMYATLRALLSITIHDRGESGFYV